MAIKHKRAIVVGIISVVLLAVVVAVPIILLSRPSSKSSGSPLPKLPIREGSPVSSRRTSGGLVEDEFRVGSGHSLLQHGEDDAGDHSVLEDSDERGSTSPASDESIVDTLSELGTEYGDDLLTVDGDDESKFEVKADEDVGLDSGSKVTPQPRRSSWARKELEERRKISGIDARRIPISTTTSEKADEDVGLDNDIEDARMVSQIKEEADQTISDAGDHSVLEDSDEVGSTSPASDESIVDTSSELEREDRDHVSITDESYAFLSHLFKEYRGLLDVFNFSFKSNRGRLRGDDFSRFLKRPCKEFGRFHDGPEWVSDLEKHLGLKLCLNHQSNDIFEAAHAQSSSLLLMKQIFGHSERDLNVLKYELNDSEDHITKQVCAMMNAFVAARDSKEDMWNLFPWGNSKVLSTLIKDDSLIFPDWVIRPHSDSLFYAKTTSLNYKIRTIGKYLEGLYGEVNLGPFEIDYLAEKGIHLTLVDDIGNTYTSPMKKTASPETIILRVIPNEDGTVSYERLQYFRSQVESRTGYKFPVTYKARK